MIGLNSIPVLGWFLAAVLCFFGAIPVYFLWNTLAPIYFYWLPQVYLDLPFWHVVGLLWLIATLKGLLLPRLHASVEVNSAKVKS